MKEECRQKFRFGPSEVYVSREILRVPITVKVKDGFSTKYVDAYVVNANVPFLLGLNTMKEWGALLDIKSEEMIFKDLGIEVRVRRNYGGHLVIPLQDLGEWSPEETVFFYEENRRGNLLSWN